MNVKYASNQSMSKCLVEVIQELRDYLRPEAQGLSDEDVVHKVMCKALDYHRQLSELKPGELLRQEEPRRKVQHGVHRRQKNIKCMRR